MFELILSPWPWRTAAAHILIHLLSHLHSLICSSPSSSGPIGADDSCTDHASWPRPRPRLSLEWLQPYKSIVLLSVSPLRSVLCAALRSVASSARHCQTLSAIMREIVHIQAGQCGNQIGAKVREPFSPRTAVLTGDKRVRFQANCHTPDSLCSAHSLTGWGGGGGEGGGAGGGFSLTCLNLQ